MIAFLQHMLHNLNNIQLKIITQLIKKRTYLRELAKAIGEIPSTTLRNIKLMTNQNLIDKHTEGKNTYYYLPRKLTSLSLIKIAENYNTLNFIKNNNNLLPIIKDILKLTKNENNVIIFGSYAKALQKKDSDLDILITSKNKNIKNKILEVNEIYDIEINPKITKNIEPNNLLIKEIIKNHIILKGGEFIYEQIYQNLD